MQEDNSDCVVMEVENLKNGHTSNGVHTIKNGKADHESESLDVKSGMLIVCS